MTVAAFMNHHYCSNCRQLFHPKAALASAPGAVTVSCPRCGEWSAGSPSPASVDRRWPILAGLAVLSLLVVVGVIVVVIFAYRMRMASRAAERIAAREAARARSAAAATSGGQSATMSAAAPVAAPPGSAAPPPFHHSPLVDPPPYATAPGMPGAPSAAPGPFPATSVAMPRLAYRWTPGAEYACHFTIVANAADEKETIHGMTVYTPMADAAPGAGLTSISFSGHSTTDSRGRMRMRFDFGSETDSGRLLVDSLGRVAECSSAVELPYWMTLLGAVGIEPLSPDGATSWTISSNTELHVSDKQDARDPFGSPFGRRRDPFGLGIPFGGAELDESFMPRSRRSRPRYPGHPELEPPAFPGSSPAPTELADGQKLSAVETTQFRATAVNGDLVEIIKTFDLKSTAAAGGSPLVHAHGSGKLTFNHKLGMMRSMEYVGAFDVTENGETKRLPITVSYTMKTPDEHAVDMARARELAAAHDAAAAREAAASAAPSAGPTSTFTPPSARSSTPPSPRRPAREKLLSGDGGLDQFQPE